LTLITAEQRDEARTELEVARAGGAVMLAELGLAIGSGTGSVIDHR
jgi:hypothetical protein